MTADSEIHAAATPEPAGLAYHRAMAADWQREWASYLLHPLTLASIALLVLNDHLLKGAVGGPLGHVITGKLSDFAGLVFFPLLLVAVTELGARAIGRRLGRLGLTRATWLWTAAVGIGFALIQLWPPVADLYQHALGVLLWPGQALLAWLAGDAAGGIEPAGHTADPTDLIALVALALPPWIVRRSRST